MQSPKFGNHSPSHKVNPSARISDPFNNTMSTITLAQPNSPLSNSQLSLFTTDELDRLNNFYEELNLEKEALKSQMNTNDSEISTLSQKLLQANGKKELLYKAQQRIFHLENKMTELAQERDGSNSRRNANGDKVISVYSNLNNINLDAATFSQKTAQIIKSELVTPRKEEDQEQDSIQELERLSAISPDDEMKDLKEKVEELSNMLNKSEESKGSLWEIIENKDNLIKQLESHIEGLKTSYAPILDDLKKKILAFSVKNQELCSSLQEKVTEISKLKENLNNMDILKEQLFISNQNNESLQRDILNMRDQNLKLEATLKTRDIELEQKEKDFTLTLEKYNNLQMIVRQSAQENQVYKTSLQNLETQYSNLRETIVTSPRSPVKTATKISTPVSKEKETRDLKDTKAKMSKVDELEKKIVVLSARKDKLTKENNELTNIIRNKRQQISSISNNKAKQISTRSCSSKDELDHHQLNVSQLMTEWDDEETKEVYQYRLSKISTCSDSNFSIKEKANTKDAGENIKKLDSAMDRLKDVERKLVAIINKTTSLKFEGKSKKIKEHFVKKSMIIEDWRESATELQQIFSEMGEGDENSKSVIPGFEAVCGSIKSLHDDSFVVFSGSNSLEAL